ncbi:MAG TPA: ATP-binding protein [Vicinamibacterales bacterium]|nr:ATP-binding protein [Vicinamibacterales bacterium]
MTILERHPLRRQLFAVAIGLFIPFAVVITWSAQRTRAEREDELREEAGSVAGAAAAALTQYFTSIDTLASSLASHPAIQHLDADASDQFLGHVLGHEPLLLNIVVTDPNGVVKGSAVPSRSIGPIVSLPYVADVVARRAPVVSGLTNGAVSGKPTIVFGYPVIRDGAVVAVLGFGVNLERLQTVFESVPLPPDSVVTLSDSTGHVLGRSRDAARYIGRVSSPHPMSPRDVPKTQLLAGLDGVERFYGNAEIDRGPWLLSVGIPRDLALARVAPIFRRDFVVTAAAMICFFLVSVLLSRQLGGGLDRLRRAADRIAAGDLSPPERAPMPTQEMVQLQDAFTTMAANLRDARTALDRQIEQERKMREALQSLQRQVVRQERLAAVGVLVSGVAHELNNPLQAILGTAELLERQPNLPAEALEEVAFVKTQSGRAREIIRNLSRFSSQQSGPAELVDLRDVVAEVAQLRRSNLQNHGIALEIDTPPVRPVRANFTEVEQVTLNFVINAQQAIEGTGRAHGRIAVRVFNSGKKVHLEVQDDGAGVSAEDEPKLFQPFFTTKPVGQGTGLGLSVSYGIIESYGGTIGYRANEWGGATFFFELPAANV